ncbi:hypothetical protein JMUB6875_21230 [Nocardia sp. JMUB6875]|uniref:rhodanese-like domain-containing protein n=1 Tax=Nocardia sp. JMUB6875 TaxID=3158170 RepID=UPI0032E64518
MGGFGAAVMISPEAISVTGLRAAVAEGGRLVDIRSQRERIDEGVLLGAIAIHSARLMPSLDPDGPERISLAKHSAVPWIVVCSDGQNSRLAVTQLRRQGLLRAASLIGGTGRCVRRACSESRSRLRMPFKEPLLPLAERRSHIWAAAKEVGREPL